MSHLMSCFLHALRGVLFSVLINCSYNKENYVTLEAYLRETTFNENFGLQNKNCGEKAAYDFKISFA